MKVFLTGGANGIGKKTAIRLLEKAHSVKVMDTDEEALQQLDQSVETFRGDVRSREDIEKALERFEPEVVINCAGFQERASVEDLEVESFEKHIDTNYLGAVKVVKEALPALRREEGRIINVSSAAGLTGLPFLSAYCASKYALEGFSDSLRMELKGSGVDVVLVEPGPINTGFNRKAQEKMRDFIPGSRYSRQYKKRLDEQQERVDVEKAAARIVKAVEARNPATRYTVTWQAYAVRKIKRFLPDRLWDRVMMSRFR